MNPLLFYAFGTMEQEGCNSTVVGFPFYMSEAESDEIMETIAQNVCLKNGTTYLYWQQEV